MERHNRFKDVTHFTLIKENGTITIPSVFMFKGVYKPILKANAELILVNQGGTIVQRR